VIGIVLAAGESSRMGRSKALLRVPGDETFVTSLLRTLHAAGLADVAVIGRPADDPLRAEVARLHTAISYLENPRSQLGQLSSLLIGIDYAASVGARGALVLPVDAPTVRVSTVSAVLRAFEIAPASIVRATYCGRHGHPVIFPSSVFDELRAADLSVGAKAVMHRDPDRVLNLDVADPGVLLDVDDPADYRRVFHRDPA
jgi:molybdenum cofactor cytidylyltransferase